MPGIGLISGPVKDRALRAMADRLARDEEAILSANEKDVDALGKSFGSELSKDRLKAAVARVRMVADDVKEMVERLRVIADQPDPVGAVTGRWERPDGLVVSRVRVPIGVIGMFSGMGNDTVFPASSATSMGWPGGLPSVTMFTVCGTLSFSCTMSSRKLPFTP